MTHSEWLEQALSGYAVTNLGQISPKTVRALDRLNKNGTLLRGTSFRFPQPKVFWVAKDYVGPLPGSLDQ